MIFGALWKLLTLILCQILLKIVFTKSVKIPLGYLRKISIMMTGAKMIGRISLRKINGYLVMD